MNIREDYLEANHFYHLYNRGINGCITFNNDENKIFFLRKVKEYLLDYVDVYAYAYCLMPNHYHLAIKVKGGICDESLISKQIGKLISSYTLSFNNKYKRHGALFERPFKRKRISDENYLKQVIVYINRNPLDISLNINEYLFSSYKSILSVAPTSVARNKVLQLFEGIENFKYCHTKESLYKFEF